MSSKKKKLLIVVNVDWFLLSHRIGIATAALNDGWEVIVAGEDTGRAYEIRELGIQFIDLKFSRSGTNPIQELKTVYNFWKIYKQVRPEVVHHITLKPVIYGSLVAKLLHIHHVVNAISGLGYVFTSNRQSLVQKIMIRLMQFSFKRKNVTIIFQNEEDRKELDSYKIIYPKNEIIKIKGSGVDLDKFRPSDFPPVPPIKILFPARMLWDKGVKELLEAAQFLKEKLHNKVQFILAGLADNENKAGISADYLNQYCDDGYIKWIGHQADMVAVYQDSHIVVLPSYREGMPKTLIEACAIGRPIITTNAIGCKECVEEGLNGYKVPVKDSMALANAIEKLIDNKEQLVKMGAASRQKAEQEFDVKNVIAKHLEIYNRSV